MTSINHPTIQELLVACFTLAGYHCTSIAAVNIASFIWAENPVGAVPDALVLDIDGCTKRFKKAFEFLHAFCTCWPLDSQPASFPLLLLTTRPDLHDELQGAGYIVEMKPFKPQALIAQVNGLMQRKRMWERSLWRMKKKT